MKTQKEVEALLDQQRSLVRRILTRGCTEQEGVALANVVEDLDMAIATGSPLPFGWYVAGRPGTDTRCRATDSES